MIDLHMHLCDRVKYASFLSVCDKTTITKAGLVSLPDIFGDRGTYNDEVLFALRENPQRFAGFGALDHKQGLSSGNGEGSYRSQVVHMKDAGFSGIKIWLGKPLAETTVGIDVKNTRMQEMFSTAEALGIPVLYHAADPPEFWDPGKMYAQDTYKKIPFEKCIEDAIYCAEQHSELKIIFAHLMFLADDLSRLENMFVSHPNIYLDTAPGRWFYAVLHENREVARRFFVENADRILFGSDALFFPDDFSTFGLLPTQSETVTTIERIEKFLTTDEKLDNPYSATQAKYPTVTGLQLPVETTIQIMQKNAEKLFPFLGGEE